MGTRSSLSTAAAEGTTRAAEGEHRAVGGESTGTKAPSPSLVLVAANSALSLQSSALSTATMDSEEPAVAFVPKRVLPRSPLVPIDATIGHRAASVAAPVLSTSIVSDYSNDAPKEGVFVPKRALPRSPLQPVALAAKQSIPEPSYSASPFDVKKYEPSEVIVAPQCVEAEEITESAGPAASGASINPQTQPVLADSVMQSDTASNVSPLRAQNLSVVEDFHSSEKMSPIKDATPVCAGSRSVDMASFQDCSNFSVPPAVELVQSQVVQPSNEASSDATIALRSQSVDIETNDQQSLNLCEDKYLTSADISIQYPPYQVAETEVAAFKEFETKTELQLAYYAFKVACLKEKLLLERFHSRFESRGRIEAEVEAFVSQRAITRVLLEDLRKPQQPPPVPAPVESVHKYRPVSSFVESILQQDAEPIIVEAVDSARMSLSSPILPVEQNVPAEHIEPNYATVAFGTTEPVDEQIDFSFDNNDNFDSESQNISADSKRKTKSLTPKNLSRSFQQSARKPKSLYKAPDIGVADFQDTVYEFDDSCPQSFRVKGMRFVPLHAPKLPAPIDSTMFSDRLEHAEKSSEAPLKKARQRKAIPVSPEKKISADRSISTRLTSEPVGEKTQKLASIESPYISKKSKGRPPKKAVTTSTAPVGALNHPVLENMNSIVQKKLESQEMSDASNQKNQKLGQNNKRADDITSASEKRAFEKFCALNRSDVVALRPEINANDLQELLKQMWLMCTEAEKEECYDNKSTKSKPDIPAVTAVSSKTAGSSTSIEVKMQNSVRPPADAALKSPRKAVEATVPESSRRQEEPAAPTRGNSIAASISGECQTHKTAKKSKKNAKSTGESNSSAEATASDVILKSSNVASTEKKQSSRKPLNVEGIATSSRNDEIVSEFVPTAASLPVPKPSVINVSTPVATSKTSSRKRKKAESEPVVAMETVAKTSVISSPLIRIKKAKTIVPVISSPAGSVFGGDNSVIMAAGASPHRVSPSIGNRSRESSVVSAMGSIITAKLIIPKLKTRKS
jgi:hypothetical protein